MAIEHRLMHAETLAYLLHQLPYRMKRKREEPPAPPAGAARWTARSGFPAGQATLKPPRAAGGFGWDNEFEERIVDVPEFTVDEHKVTNGRFLEFVESGGYQNPSHWTDENWAWKESAKLKHPDLLVEAGRGSQWRGMFSETPLPERAAVYVSHAEASAFARWAGRALLERGAVPPRRVRDPLGRGA